METVLLVIIIGLVAAYFTTRALHKPLTQIDARLANIEQVEASLAKAAPTPDLNDFGERKLCPSCAKRVNHEATICPRCNYEFDRVLIATTLEHDLGGKTKSEFVGQIDEHHWISLAANTLNELRTSQIDFCVFDSGDHFVQFAGPLKNGFVCETDRCLNQQKIVELRNLGFSEPDASSNDPNFLQFVEMNSETDAVTVAHMALKVLTDIHEAREYRSLSIRVG